MRFSDPGARPRTSAPLRLQPQWRLYRRPQTQQAGPRPRLHPLRQNGRGLGLLRREYVEEPEEIRPALAARLARRREALSPPLQACGLISLPTYALAGDTERAAAELAEARRLSCPASDTDSSTEGVKPTFSGEFRSFLGECRLARQPISNSEQAAPGLIPRGLPCERVSARAPLAYGLFNRPAGHDFFSSLSIASSRKRLSTEADAARRWCDVFATGVISDTAGIAPEIREGSILLMWRGRHDYE
jgi:hypothetical protein